MSDKEQFGEEREWVKARWNAIHARGNEIARERESIRTRLRALRESLDLVKARITKDVHLERGSDGKLIYFTAEFRRAEVKLRLANDERATKIKDEMNELEARDVKLLDEWNGMADEREYLFRRLDELGWSGLR